MQPQSLHCINPECSSPLSAADGKKFCLSCGAPLLLNRRYLPLKKLGTGGFAITYIIYDRQTKSERVLKVLIETAPKALALFQQEAAVLTRLRHPGVPRVERDSYFQINLRHPKPRVLPCLVMEKIEGETLETIIDRFPQGCPEALALDWAIQATDILGELHRHQIIHRDIKPANLMIRRSPNQSLAKSLSPGSFFKMLNQGRIPPGSVGGQLVAIDFGGVKQLSGPQGTSTRLYSPGYSPPEQMAGALVGPGADFYALGRTLVHLLTGRSPAEFDDPKTGRCRWRQHAASVTPLFANAIEETLELDPNKRPTSAAKIQARLVNASNLTTIVRTRVPGLLTRVFEMVLDVADRLRKQGWGLATTFAIAVVSVILFLYRAIAGVLQTFFSVLSWSLQACFDTVLAMWLAGLGASVGAGTGFALAYWSPMGTEAIARLSQLLTQWFGPMPLTLDPVLILFSMAGLGTALGLTEAGSFGQRRRFVTAGLMGTVGYGCGWLLLHAALEAQPLAAPDLVGFSAIAIASIALGVGLPKPHLFHASISAIGSAFLVARLLYTVSPPALLHLLSDATDVGWLEFWESIAFFSALGIVGSFFLGVSYYLLVPVLKFLGWR
jgi:hypothetical protein